MDGLPPGFTVDEDSSSEGLPPGFKVDSPPPEGYKVDEPIPSARDQYVKAAGKLLAHATLVARNAASDLLDPIGRSLSDLSEKEGLKADTPLEAMGAASKAAGYKANIAEIAVNPILHSQDIVERLTKAAHESAIQFGIKPSDEEKTQNPNLAALGPLPMKAMRAYQALIDNALPEVQALGRWVGMKQAPLTDRLNEIITHSKNKTALDAAAIAPVETTDHEIPKFDLALRTAYEVPNQMLHGALDVGVAMLNPVTAAEAELMGKVGGLMARGMGEVVARTAPEAGLRVALSPVSKIRESATAHVSKPISEWNGMDYVHSRVQAQTNAALEGVQAKTGASPAAMKAAAAAADRAGYEAAFRRLVGLKESGVPVNAEAPPTGVPAPEEAVPPRQIGMEGARGEGFTMGGNPPPGEVRRVFNPGTGREEVLPAKTIPTEPVDVAAQTIGAGALGPEVARVAKEYPSLYSVATGAEVPKAVRAELEGVVGELQARGVAPGSLTDMLAEGVATGKASFVRLAKLNENLLRAALTEAGAMAETLPRHAADLYTAAERPGETLVAHGMQVEAEKAAVLARARASEDVWAEAHRELAAAEAAGRPAPAAESGAGAPEQPQEAAAAPLPSRAEAVALAAEAGESVEEAAAAHREAALAEQEAGTLDPGIAQEYADQGDASFDPAALEALSHPFPNLAKHPAEMTWEEFQAEYPGMEKDTHQAIVDEAAYHAEEEARRDRADMLESAGISAQPAHDLLRKSPIGEDWIEKLGLRGEFAASKGKGITVKGTGGDEGKVDYAVTRLIEAGILPEGASINDMLDVLDHEARKGSKASAEASMVREEAGPGEPGPTPGGGTPGGGPSSRPGASSRASGGGSGKPYDLSIDRSIEDVKARADDWLAREAAARGMEAGDKFTLQFGTYVHDGLNSVIRPMVEKMKAAKTPEEKMEVYKAESPAVEEQARELSDKLSDISAAYPKIAEQIPHGDIMASEKILEGFKPVQEPPAEGGGSMVKDEGDAKVFTPAFKKWFGKSKVVDADGQPLRVYHGTNQKIEEFLKKRMGANTNSASSRSGFFFTEHAEEAGDYAAMSARKQVSNAIEAEANSARLLKEIDRANNVRNFDLAEKLTLELEESEREGMTGEERGANVIPVYLNIKNPMVFDMKGKDLHAMRAAIREAKKKGYDGMRLENVFDPVSDRDDLSATTQWVAFKPNQIKSAFNKNPTKSASIVEDSGFDDGAQGFLFDDQGRTNPDAIAPKEETLPEKKRERAIGVDGPILVSFAGKTYPVESLAKASELWDKVREGSQAEGLGSRDLSADPLIVDENGKTLGWISYNGRTWKGPPPPEGTTRVEWLDGPSKPAKEGDLPLLEADPAGARKALIENPTDKPLRERAPGEITDVGQELWYNRRNLVSKGLRWEDIRDLNPTLKALEVQKTKIWPRPDYASLVEGGMNPLTAHLVKQVYDSIATKPAAGYQGAGDAQMEAYINEVARIKEAVFTWAKDIGAQKGLLEGLMEAAKARMGGVSIISQMGRGAAFDGLLDALYPKNAEGQRWGRSNQVQNDLVNLVGGRKFADALSINTESARVAVKAINQGWPAPQEAWEKRFEIREVPAGTRQWSREKGEYKNEKPYFEIKVRAHRGMMVRGEFPTREAAVARAKELAAKKKDTRKNAEAAITDFERKGPPQRPGGLDVTPKALQDKFGFRGINFGNYTDQGERQVFTNNAYDSLLDLADIVGLPAEAISLNGTLGLAYGAQGRGGKRAAHFVPGVNEINLTKDSGAGSLAHEWWHALDHYFAVQAGESYAKSPEPYLTHLIEFETFRSASKFRPEGGLAGLRPEIRKAFLDIVETMKKVKETPEQVEARIESYRAHSSKRLESWIKYFRDRVEAAGTMEAGKPKVLSAEEKALNENHLKQFDLLADALRRGDVGEGWEQIGRGAMSAVRTTVGEVRRLYKDAVGHMPSPDDIKALDSSAYSIKAAKDAKRAAEDRKPQSTTSQYAHEAASLDAGKKKGYWSQETELGARAFQSYILDRLEALNRRNDYLTRPQLTAEQYKEFEGGDRYPRGAERERINAAFDVLVKSLLTKESPTGGTMVYDEAEPAPAFYSKLERDVEAKMGKSATVEQVRALLRDQKADEVEWTGISDFLEGKKTVTKAEVLDYLRANRLEIKEVMKGGIESKAEEGRLRVRKDDIEREFSKLEYYIRPAEGGYDSRQVSLEDSQGFILHRDDIQERLRPLYDEYSEVVGKLADFEEGSGDLDGTKFKEYTLPGGENYRELLLTLPPKPVEIPSTISNEEIHAQAKVDAEGRGKKWEDLNVIQKQDYINNVRYRFEAAKNDAFRATIFNSSHFDEPNILAHVRFDDRVDAGGKKVLFIEEVQSDWHQKGRKGGYQNTSLEKVIKNAAEMDDLDDSVKAVMDVIGVDFGDEAAIYFSEQEISNEDWPKFSVEKRAAILQDYAKYDKSAALVPNAPLKKTWHEFALKRMIRYAAENGYDSIAWTTGEQQAERYDLSKQVKEVHYKKVGEDFDVWATDKNNSRVEIGVHPASRLPDVVGKDLAAKIVAGEGKSHANFWVMKKGASGRNVHSFGEYTELKEKGWKEEKASKENVTSLSGGDLKVGGEGMKGFYDKMVPAFLNKFGKKYGAQVGMTTIKHGEGKVNATPNELHSIMEEVGPGEFQTHSFPITEALRDTAMREGFTVYDKPSDETAKAYGPGVDMKAVKKQVQLELDFGGSGQIVNQFKATGKVDYIGKSLETWQDAAEVVASMRHTRLEHMHYILVKEGRVVGHRVISSGLPDAVLITERQFREIMEQADALGADAIYDGHNHPSGDPTPSRQDGSHTEMMRSRIGSRYRGSVVTDHEEFSVINANRGGRGGPAVSRLKFDVPKEMHQDLKAPQLMGRDQEVAEAFKNGFDGTAHTVIYLDTKRRVMAIEHVPVDADLPASVRAGVLRVKAHSASIVTAVSKYKPKDLPNQVRAMVLVDQDGYHDMWDQAGQGFSAYGAGITSHFVQDEPIEQAPRYMGAQGMDADDFAKAIAEAKVVPGSKVTLRVKLEGMPKGTPGKVLSVGQKTQTLLVQFDGETVPRAVRAENLAETNRKPAARAELEAAQRAAKTSGKPSMPVKRIVQNQQAGTAKVPPTITEQTALKGALEAEARGAKRADMLAQKEMRAKIRAQERAARAELGTAQKNLRHAVLEAQMAGRWEAATRNKVVEFAKAFLPPSERGALLTKVASAKTNNDLLEAFHYIDQKATEYANKKAMKDIRVLVARVKASKTFPVSVKLQIEDLISDIRLENWTASTLDKIAAQQSLIVAARAAGAEVDVPQAVLDQIAKLTKRPLAELDGVEMADILADLRFLVERGREIRAMTIDLKEIDREEALADLVAGTKRVYIKPSTDRGAKREFGGKSLTWAQEMKNKWLANCDTAQAAGIFLRPAQAIMDDLDGTFLGGGPNRREWNRLQDAYIDAKGYIARKEAEFGEAVKRLGPLNQEERDRILIVAYREQHDVRPHLHKMGLGDDQIDAVKETPKERAYLDAARALFNRPDEIAKLSMVAAVLNNEAFVPVDNYFPIMTKYMPMEPGTSAAEILNQEVALRKKSVDRGRLIARRVGAARELRTDFEGIVLDAVKQQANLMYMAIPLLRAHSIFTDPAYEAAAGDAAVEFWKDYIDTLARDGRMPTSAVDRWLAGRMHALGAAALAFKPNVALIQLSSLGPGSTIVGGKYVSRALRAGKEWDGFVDQHMPLVKGRQGGDPAVRDVMHGGVMPKVAEAGFKHMVKTDHWTASQVALGAYFQFLDKAGIPADPLKPHPPALRYAQSVTGRTMASPWLIDMPLALSRGGPLVKGALQFQSETLAKWALMKDLAQHAGEDSVRSVESAVYLTSALLFETGVRSAWRYLVMASLFAAGAIDKKQWDYFEKKSNSFFRQLVGSAANSIPFVGAVADAVMYDAGPIPVVNTTVDALAGIGNGVVGAVNGKPIAAMKAIVSGLTAMASIAGVPGAGTLGFIAKQPLKGKTDKKQKRGYAR